MVQYLFEKWAETPSRGAIGCCSNVPDLKKDILYNLMAIIGQWYNTKRNDDDDDFVESMEKANSVRTIEPLAEFVPQTFKHQFQNFLLKANQQFVEILLKTCIFQSHSIYPEKLCDQLFKEH